VGRFRFTFQDNGRTAAVGEPFRLDVIRFKRGAAAPAGAKRQQHAGKEEESRSHGKSVPEFEEEGNLSFLSMGGFCRNWNFSDRRKPGKRYNKGYV
jgi:hypothetical protein